eukprot:scaffold133373_cov75-Phaeocystis_antarctica.AAC.1
MLIRACGVALCSRSRIFLASSSEGRSSAVQRLSCTRRVGATAFFTRRSAFSVDTRSFRTCVWVRLGLGVRLGTGLGLRARG